MKDLTIPQAEIVPLETFPLLIKFYLPILSFDLEAFQASLS